MGAPSTLQMSWRAMLAGYYAPFLHEYPSHVNAQPLDATLRYCALCAESSLRSVQTIRAHFKGPFQGLVEVAQSCHSICSFPIMRWKVQLTDWQVPLWVCK